MEGPARRLAAVAIVDLVGFSRLMADDEAGTLAALRAHRNATDPVLLNQGGRIVKTTGDGMLLEFPSATAAVAALAEMQDIIRTRNETVPEDRRMAFRVGVNLADVVVDQDGDIFGDGVNVAARIEPLAPPNGLAVTNAVREAIRGKVDVPLHDAGEHRLKNIDHPVRVWTTVGRGASSAATPPSRTVAIVAVLPFDNMSGDQEQEYFADGITEDLLTALSYERYLNVVARNSTFAYKGRATDARTIARELDATHIVEGSVRKAGHRVRVTAQLIEAERGTHLWAERWDRDLDDVFALQDELVGAIAGSLRPTLWDEAGSRRQPVDASSLDAWDLYLRGRYAYNRHTTEGYLEAIDWCERSRALDPTFPRTVATIAAAWAFLATHGWRGEEDPWKRALEEGELAFSMDPDDPEILAQMAALSMLTGNLEQGLRTADRAIEINPHGPSGYHFRGAVLNAMGRLDEAVDALSEAWRLGRREPLAYDIANDLAWSHYMLGNYEASRQWGLRAIELRPSYLQAHLALAAATAQLGLAEQVRPHVERIQAVRPDFGTQRYRTRILYRDDAQKDHIIEGLRKAGLAD